MVNVEGEVIVIGILVRAIWLNSHKLNGKNVELTQGHKNFVLNGLLGAGSVSLVVVVVVIYD